MSLLVPPSQVRLISNQFSGAGIGNGADTTQDVLFTYSIPAGTFAIPGKSVLVTTSGSWSATGNQKHSMITVNGTLMIEKPTTTTSNISYNLELEITVVDSTHINVKGTGTANVLIIAKTSPNFVVADLTTNALVINSVGASPTTGAANDVVAYTLKVLALN